MNISPLNCPDTDCYWAAHGIPDAYTEARAWHLAVHRAEEHSEPLTAELIAYAVRVGHVIPHTARVESGPAVADRLTPQQEAEIAARAGHLYEYSTRHDSEWDALAGEDVPALLAELAAVRAERDQARALVAELEAEREKLVRWHGEDSKTITGLVARVDRRRARLVALQNDALSMRGSLAPADGDRKVPFELGETLTPAVDWLIARVAELEALKPAPIQTCRVCGAGYSYGQSCSTCEFKARMAAETGGAS